MKFVHKYKNNSEMNVKEMGWDNIQWIHVVQDRYKFGAHVNMVINI